MLRKEVDSLNQKCNDYKLMYENQILNKKKLTEFYEKKMGQLIRDKDILVKKYEEKMRMVSSKNSSYSQHFDSTTSLK